MSIPSDATKTNCDSTADDPKLALTVDLADLITSYNALLAHLRASGILTGGTTAAMGIGQGLESDGDAASPLLRAKIVSGGGIGRGASGLSLDISGMTEETSVDATADYVPLYDASGTVVRKVKVNNLLPYAAGSWTPVLAGNTTAGSNTYSTQIGRYVRVGDLVTLWFSLVLTAKDAAMAGPGTLITGLPFTSSNISGLKFSGSIGQMGGIDLSAGYSMLGLSLAASANQITLVQAGDNVAANGLSASAISNTTEMHGSINYRIN